MAVVVKDKLLRVFTSTVVFDHQCAAGGAMKKHKLELSTDDRRTWSDSKNTLIKEVTCPECGITVQYRIHRPPKVK